MASKSPKRGRPANPDTQKTLDRGIEPWERQSWENDTGFHYFTVYRDLGPRRTLAKVSQAVGTKAGLSLYSGPGRWQERVAAFDAHRDKLRVAAALEAEADHVVEMKNRHMNMAKSVLRLASVELARHLHRLGAAAAQPDLKADPTVSLRDLVHLMEYSVKLERLNSNLATDHQILSVQEKAKTVVVPKDLGHDARIKLISAISQGATE